MTKKSPPQKPKVVCLLGPTACGKTKLGVFLAKKFNGEIVSADSRQVYKYLDICTGKDKKDYTINGTKIPCHLIDFLEPYEEFSAPQFQKKAYRQIKDILKRKKLPLLVGGSPFYLYSVIDGWVFPKIKSDKLLRQKLRQMSLPELNKILKEIDPIAHSKIDQKNPRRLERAIEVCVLSGKKFEEVKPKSKPQFDFLVLGVSFSLPEIKRRIKKRLKERIKEGMIEEVEKILKEKKAKEGDLERLGLEPRFVTYYLQGKIKKKQLEELLLKNIYSFARRQMNWFKKDERIVWVKDNKNAERKIKEFLLEKTARSGKNLEKNKLPRL